MSQFSEYIKERKQKVAESFFGKSVVRHDDNIAWDGYIDDETIIVLTKNVRYWKNKDQFVMLIGNNKYIYLRSCDVVEVKNWHLELNAYAVKLNRKYFKAYTINGTFDDVMFEKEDSFESLLEVAKTQETKEIKNGWKLGHYDCL